MTEIIKIEKQNVKEFNLLIKIRREVFIKEQNCSEGEEWDDDKYDSNYYLAFYDNIPCGTLRWRINNDKIKIERLAVLKDFRNKYIGFDIMRFALNDIEKLNYEVYLHSQEYVICFYEKFGFRVFGERFYEENIPHFAMNLARQ